jgi:hypothetical protein
LGIFYAALVASSAFGGLLAYGIFHITSGPYPSWAYLFFLEGSLTVIWAVVIVCILPTDSENAWFLNEAERRVTRLRLEYDSVQCLDNIFSWKESMSEFRTAHPYIRAIMAFCNGVVLTSNSTFLAMIVERMGYSTVKTNLVSFPFGLTTLSLRLSANRPTASIPLHQRSQQQLFLFYILSLPTAFRSVVSTAQHLDWLA